MEYDNLHAQYCSHAKIRPPFLHFTLRNKRGLVVFTRNMQFYSKLGPLLRTQANGASYGLPIAEEDGHT